MSSKRPIPYFEADGSYNEWVPRPTRRPVDDRFRFDWSRPLAPQVEGRLACPEEFARIDAAAQLLENVGVLPPGRLRALQRQIDMRADRLIRRFTKSRTPNPES